MGASRNAKGVGSGSGRENSPRHGSCSWSSWPWFGGASLARERGGSPQEGSSLLSARWHQHGVHRGRVQGGVGNGVDVGVIVGMLAHCTDYATRHPKSFICDERKYDMVARYRAGCAQFVLAERGGYETKVSQINGAREKRAKIDTEGNAHISSTLPSKMDAPRAKCRGARPWQQHEVVRCTV